MVMGVGCFDGSVIFSLFLYCSILFSGKMIPNLFWYVKNVFSKSHTYFLFYAHLIISFPILKEPLSFLIPNFNHQTFQHRIVFLLKYSSGFVLLLVLLLLLLVICLFFLSLPPFPWSATNPKTCFIVCHLEKKNLYNIFVQKAIKVFWFNKIYIGIFVKVLQKAFHVGKNEK